MLKRLFIPLSITAALALSACSSPTSPSADSATTGSTDTVATTTQTAPNSADDVQAPVINSATPFSLVSAIKDKPVAFWFWAPG